MNPISENAYGGVGYTIDQFVDNFITICYEHLRERRAKAFAFIFFDSTHESIEHVLTDQSGFARLDRLSGHDITIFYMISDNELIYRPFNEFFQETLGVREDIQLPSVVFFRVIGNEAEDVEVHRLDNNLMFAFERIESLISDFKGKVTKDSQTKVKFVGKMVPWLAERGINVVVDKLLTNMMGKN